MTERKIAAKAQPTVRPIAAGMERGMVDAVLLEFMAGIGGEVVDPVLPEFGVPS